MSRSTVIAVVACLGMMGIAGCGSQRESLSDCMEEETGYIIHIESGRVNCEEASILLGLLGAAEHGVQTIEERGGRVWKCRAFPEKPNAPKYRCWNGSKRFVVLSGN